MKTIKVKNTKDIRLKGKPKEEVLSLDNSKQVALCPSLIPLIKPKMLVKVGDKVKIGTPIFFDKQDSDLKFASPASGIVEDIIYGDRRAIDAVVIKCSDKDEYEQNAISDISSINAKTLKQEIANSGLWGIFRQFPFLNIPKTDEALPNSIYISMDEDEPYYPLSQIYLRDNLDDFKSGLKAINKLFSSVNISASSNNKEILNTLDGIITHKIKGNYPANNAGSFLYYDKTDAKQNNSCTIKPQDIIKLGHMLNTGKYLNKRIITISGSLLGKPTHAIVKEGAQIKDILSNENIKEEHRIVVGGTFKGRSAKEDNYLGFGEEAIHILSQELKQDMFGFMKFGFNKHTLSRAYLSFLMPKKEIQADVSLYGENRSCISCGICPSVCPVELFPQEIMKNLLADRRGEALELGMLDCVECGLCTYACPCKIEVADIIKQAKNNLYKELNT